MLAIYKASAGSGKTFTLAYEYIKMLLGVKNPDTGRYSLNRGQRDRHRHILAVTFTKKATGEMKERIIHELAVLGNLEYKWPDPSPYAKRLCDELHCTPDELTKAAATALRQLLFDFNFFQVNTIDSFFQGILRTFAHEVDVSGNYEVDLDSDRAISQSVRDLFDSLSTDSPDGQSRRLQRWITQYLIGQLNSGRQVSLFNRSSTVYSNFIEFIKSISNDVFDEHYGKMMDYLSNPERLQKLYTSLSKQADSQIKETKSLCRAAVDAITSRGYDGSGKLKVSAYLMKKLKEMAGAGECKDIGKTVAAVNEDILNAFTGNLKKLMEQSADTGLCDAISDATRSITEGAARLAMLRDIRSNIFVLGLLKNIYDFIEKYRKDNNTLILSDTNTLLRTIIGDDDAPFVYERTGTWINHFLIDEFQDTSKVQWENLRPLLHEGQSVGNDSLIIGDEKQCIYRFRFSDPTLLQHQVQEDFGVKSMIKGNDSAGNTNWRSSADVVSFNNDFFSAIAGMTGFTDIYANVRQQISPKHKDHRGYIKLTGVGHTEGATFSETALRLLTDDIVRQLRAGYRPCDIAVLTRFNNEAADVIASLMEACKEHEELRGVRIISDDAMSIASSPAVRLIISVMRFLDMPAEEAAEESGEGESTAGKRRKARLREIGRLMNIYEHNLSRTGDVGESLRVAIAGAGSTSGAGIVTTADSEAAGSMACFNVPSLVERIIARYISPETARDQNMYIAAFVDEMTSFCSTGSADLHAFLQWWDDKGCRAKISAPFDENALMVMSIHKSKGLEFKCVHIPFADWRLVNFKSIEWFEPAGAIAAEEDIIPPLLPLKPAEWMKGTALGKQYDDRCREQLLDEINVAYVAMTRAVNELSVCYPLAGSKSGRDNLNDIIMQALGSVATERTEESEDGTELVSDTIGSPTTREADKKEERRALDPEGTVDMEPYVTADRDDLWGKLDIERYVDYGVARGRGIVLHDVLSRVRHPEELESAVRYCSYRGRLPREATDEVCAYLSRELKRDDVAGWFNGYRRVICERTLVLANGDVCRPDRVVWRADGHVDVVDYKFGEEKPKLYGKQVRAYMEALRAAGCEDVRGYLWYVDSGIIRRVEA